MPDNTMMKTSRASVLTLSRIMLLMSLFVFSSSSAAPPVPLTTANNSLFYYNIGGASSITVPPNTRVKTTKLGGSFKLGIGYSCGKFDPTLGLSNILNSLSNSGNNLVNGAVGAVTAAIGSLPALILQRVNPGLYDLFQNGVIRAEAVLALANKTCEDMEYEISQGKNPYSDWITLSKSEDWKDEMGATGYGGSKSDVVQAKKKVETNNGDNGIFWVGGIRAGGIGQEPIRTTEDVVKAGYNITLNRAPTNTGTFTISSGSATSAHLVDLWPTPDDAANWAVEVLGDTYVRTYEGHPRESISGHGLLPKIHSEQTQIQTEWSTLAGSQNPAVLSDLHKVSSSDLLITDEVVKSIRALEPTEQSIAINKLASEVAMSRTLEKALYIRRLLIAGRREPNIESSPAPKNIDETLDVLDQEIENLLFEKRVRTELAASTASFLLNLTAQHKNRGRQQFDAAANDQNMIINGATR